jgi:putative transposase
VLRAHKILIRVTAKDLSYFTRCAGVERYAFNWCLQFDRTYFSLNGETISDFELMRLWNAHRKLMLPWTYEITKHASDTGAKNFCTARSNWFRALKTGNKRVHRPKLKTKRRSKPTFSFHGRVQVEGRTLVIPKYGAVRLAKELRFPGSRDAR